MNDIKKTVIKRIFVVLWIIITFSAVLIIIYMAQQIIGENKQLIKTAVDTSVNVKVENKINEPQYTTKNIIIYVLPKNKECLQPIDTQIEWKPKYEENCKQILNKMKELNTENYNSPIPKDITIRGVYLTPDGELLIDLPATIISNYKDQATTFLETLFTYAIVDTLLQSDLVVNTSVKQIRFLIEGSLPSMDFPSHISWKQPFIPDYSFVCNK